MLLTLLLVIIGGMGMVSVCQCHSEIFMGACSCHESTVTCDCPHSGSNETQAPSQAATHHCMHQNLELDLLTIPAAAFPVASPAIVWQPLPEFHQLTTFPASSAVTHVFLAPDPPDLPPEAARLHGGVQLPLLI